MTNDHPHALDDAVAQQPPEPLHHLRLGETDAPRYRRIRTGGERQSVLDGPQETSVESIERRRRGGRTRAGGRGTRARRRPTPKGEPEVDVVGPFEAQVQYLEAGTPPDVREGLVQLVHTRGGEHEPEIELVLALIVVVDRPIAVHTFGDRLEPRRGDRHRRQGARADTPRGEYRADPAHHPALLEGGQAPEHLVRLAVETIRDLRERRLADRKAALVLVEQPPVQRIENRGAGQGEAVHYRPMRWARAEKKMPLGCSAGTSASFSWLRVS